MCGLFSLGTYEIVTLKESRLKNLVGQGTLMSWQIWPRHGQIAPYPLHTIESFGRRTKGDQENPHISLVRLVHHQAITGTLDLMSFTTRPSCTVMRMLDLSRRMRTSWEGSPSTTKMSAALPGSRVPHASPRAMAWAEV